MHGLKKALTDIWRLTLPYFTSRELTEARIWPFPAFAVQQRLLAFIFAAVIISIEFALVAINVRLSYFSRDWFNAIQNRDAASFWTLLLTVFMFWAVIYIVAAIYQYALKSYLRIRWRAFLTARYVSHWLDHNAHYHMQLLGHGADNPDQRIQQDIDSFIVRTMELFLGLLSSVSTLVSFAVVLWQLSASFTLPGTDLRVPGFLLWGALVFAIAATWLTHRVGRPLIRLNFEQEKYEADFRFSLARLREYGEQVALTGGAPAEKRHLAGRFGSVIDNFLAIVSRTKKLTAVTAAYAQISNVIPYILVAPYYFAGKVTLGGMQQTASAFNRVSDSLSFFISAYTTLADYKAVVDRLTTFTSAVETARIAGSGASRLRREEGADANLEIRNLSLSLPDGREVVRVGALTLRPGETTLLTGPSGSGKSTLFRAIAGIWPFGSGDIRLPHGAPLLLLPQRPYLPVGTLRAAACYPAAPDAWSTGELAEALAAVQLPHLVARLDEEDHWAQTLSLGEQQRLALARALLARPDWLFLDEATSAMDEGLEASSYGLLARALPQATIVSIGHRSTLHALHARRIDMINVGGRVFEPRDVYDAAPAAG